MMDGIVEELWEPIEGHENYLVSNYGEVINKKTNYALRSCSDHKGYQKVSLYKNGIRETKYIHRMVAKAFLIDYEDGLAVVHKIENNKLDNSVLNLKVSVKKKRKAFINAVC